MCYEVYFDYIRLVPIEMNSNRYLYVILKTVVNSGFLSCLKGEKPVVGEDSYNLSKDSFMEPMRFFSDLRCFFRGH